MCVPFDAIREEFLAVVGEISKIAFVATMYCGTVRVFVCNLLLNPNPQPQTQTNTC
jgi:hypothetical protein